MLTLSLFGVGFHSLSLFPTLLEAFWFQLTLTSLPLSLDREDGQLPVPACYAWPPLSSSFLVGVDDSYSGAGNWEDPPPALAVCREEENAPCLYMMPTLPTSILPICSVILSHSTYADMVCVFSISLNRLWVYYYLPPFFACCLRGEAWLGRPGALVGWGQWEKRNHAAQPCLPAWWPVASDSDPSQAGR